MLVIVQIKMEKNMEHEMETVLCGASGPLLSGSMSPDPKP